MITKILRLWVIGLLFFANESKLYANDDPEIALSQLNSIRMQQQSYPSGERQHLIEDPLHDYQISNRFALACGRCHFCNSDFYISYSERENSDCPCTSWTSCMTSLSVTAGGLGGTLIWNIVNVSCQSPAWHLITWTPTFVAGGVDLLCGTHALTGATIYCCAGCMDKNEFKRNFQRGVYCAQTDRCSCTSTGLYRVMNCVKTERYSCKSISNCCKNLWTPCCGESYDRLE